MAEAITHALNLAKVNKDIVALEAILKEQIEIREEFEKIKIETSNAFVELIETFAQPDTPDIIPVNKTNKKPS